MAPTEPYERPYNIVFGAWGAEQQVVPVGKDGPDVPVYKARQMVCAMLNAEEQKAKTPDQKETMQFLRRQFKDAPLGDLVFGMIRRWKNSHGVERFIGVVEKGQDYKDAGKVPADMRPNKRRQPAHRPVVIEKKPWERDRDRRRAERHEPAKKQPTEAERIAAKMAKASRDAAEGS